MKGGKNFPVVIAVNGTSIYKMGMAATLLFLVLLVAAGFFALAKYDYTIKSSSASKQPMNVDGKLLYRIIGWENHAFMQTVQDDTPAMSEILLEMSANINLDDPRSLLGRELPGFTLFDGKIVVAGEGTNYTNLPLESAPPQEVLKAEEEAELKNVEGMEKEGEDRPLPYPAEGSRKRVYVYFSHTRESFLPYLKGVTNPDAAHHSKINVTKIGDFLKEELESYGIGTEVDKTDVMSILNKKGMSYARSYDASRSVVEAALMKNGDLTYLIDIHRDSQRRPMTTKNIGGKNYAKLAFVIGGENPRYEENLKLAYQLHKKLEEKYPGLSRGIVEKKGAHTNGKFNQDLSTNALLIEFGGVDNTFEELERSAAAFAQVFSEIFWDAEPVDNQDGQPAQEL